MHHVDAADAAGDVVRQHSADDDPEAYEPGAVLVTLAKGATLQDARAALSGVPELATATATEVVDGLLKVELPASLSVNDATPLVAGLDCIDAAQPNYRYRTVSREGALFPEALSSSRLATTARGGALGLASALNDPFYGDQWHLASINAEKAWSSVAAQGTSPSTVAVIDAGFYTSHEDLRSNIASVYDATKEKTVSIESNLDSNQVNHGTHCAGIIAATANNALGVAGVTDNVCKVLPLRVEDDGGSIYTSYVAQAYSHLVANKDAYSIRVVNISLGAPCKEAANRLTDTVLYDCIQKGRNAGILTIAAACNDSNATPPYYAYPADFDNVVSVIALDQDASNADGVARASYSNYNTAGQRAKNISAPGSNILSLRGTKNWEWGAYYETLYGTMDGTSMAAPVVSGVMGLMFAANPDLTVDEATSKLYSSAKDLTKSSGANKGWDRATGFGEVDLAAAVSSKQPYLSGAAKVTVGKPKALTVKIDGEKQPASGWKWASSNTAVATVNSSGVITGKKAGRVVITAAKGSFRIRQVVLVRVPAKALAVTFSKSLVYTGEARKLAPRVSFADRKLKAGHDYTVKYSKSVNAGKATVTITGVAPYYTGTKKVTFKIAKAPLAKARVKLSATKLRYTGKARKPAVTVYDIGKNAKVKLKRGVDYTIRFKAVKRGKGTVKITAKSKCANFKGTVTKTFRVG